MINFEEKSPSVSVMLACFEALINDSMVYILRKVEKLVSNCVLDVFFMPIRFAILPETKYVRD